MLVPGTSTTRALMVTVSEDVGTAGACFTLVITGANALVVVEFVEPGVGSPMLDSPQNALVRGGWEAGVRQL